MACSAERDRGKPSTQARRASTIIFWAKLIRDLGSKQRGALIAAKQEAFEEANKLKNQFRALDQDEIEFLDSVMESTRREEERVKKETREGLEIFRKQQEAQDKQAHKQSGGDIAEVVGEESWTAATGKKRKRAKEKEVLKGVKVRRASTAEETVKSSETAAKSTDDSSTTKADTNSKSAQVSQTKQSGAAATAGKQPERSKITTNPTKGSLVAYGSDSD